MTRLIDEIIIELNNNGNYAMLHEFIAHGTKTVFDHSRDVAIESIRLKHKYGIEVDERRLITAALLHDYYLYDWHDKNGSHQLHGFFHGKIAGDNALRDYDIDVEIRHAIERHMFPLTIMPPNSKIGIIVTIADKICATRETLFMRRKTIRD